MGEIRDAMIVNTTIKTYQTGADRLVGTDKRNAIIVEAGMNLSKRRRRDC